MDEARILKQQLHAQAHGDYNCTSLLALQGLRNLQTHLYLAASHYESSYLCSQEKLAALESLKDFTTKVFADSLDHMSTIASQLNESIAQCGAELSNIQIRMSCLAQRVSTCHEWRSSYGLNKWRSKNSKLQPMANYPRDYTTSSRGKFSASSIPMGSYHETISQETRSRQSDWNTLRTLSWYLSTDLSTINSGCLHTNQTKLSSSSRHYEEIAQTSQAAPRTCFRSQSCRKFPLSYTQQFNSSLRPRIQDSSMIRSKSLLALMISTDLDME